jgi:hypothetical protein
MAGQSSLDMKVEGLLRSCEKGNGIVAGCKQMISLLLEEKVALKLTIPPLLVGVHPTNRDGYGVNPHDVHALMDDIFSLGWDTSKVSALCVELEPGDIDVRLFNERLAEESRGLLAPVDAKQLRYVSLWGSHTNQVLRAVSARLQHGNQEMTIEGRLDVGRIEIRDKDFAECVREGIQWIVLPNALFKSHPGLAEFLQSAGNASGQVSKPEHELQLLRKVHNCYLTLQQTSPNGRVAYDEVKARVLRSKPPCSASLPGMYTFVLRHGGGPSGKLLLETEAFIKANASTMINLSPDIWDALSCDIKSREQMSCFRHGLLKAMYLLSDSKVLGLADVKRLGGREWIAKVQVAETLMQQVRSLVLQHSVPQHLYVDSLGIMDVEIVMFALEKRHKAVQVFASMGGIAHKAIASVSAAAGVAIVSPWQADVVKNAVVAHVPAEHETVMREFHGDGRMMNPNQPLIDAGFNVGVDVVRRQDKRRGTISVLGEPSFVMSDTGDMLQVSAAELLALWKMIDNKPGDSDEAEELVDFDQHVADQSPSFQTLVHKQLLIAQMSQLTIKHPLRVGDLRVFVKPKKVEVTAPVKKNDLVIVPVTLKIECKKEDIDDGPTPLSVDVGCDGGFRFWLTSSNQLPNSKKNIAGFVSPFWLLTVSSTKEDCNMELHFFKDVLIPVARNTKALSAGDTLVLYRPTKEDQVQDTHAAKEKVRAKTAPAAKRQRVK